MLQVGKCINDYENWPEDLQLSISSSEDLFKLEGVLSPQQGLILRETAGDGVQNSLVIRKGQIQMASPQLGCYVLASGLGGVLEIEFSLVPEQNDNYWKTGIGFKVNGEVSPGSEGKELGYRIKTTIPPAFWLYVADSNDTRITRLDDKNIMIAQDREDNNYVMIFNPDTGRIVEFKSIDSTVTALIQFRQGAFEEQARMIQEQIDAAALEPIHTNSFGFLLYSALPVYLCHWAPPALTLEQKRAALQAWDRILTDDLLACFTGDKQPAPVAKDHFFLPHYELVDSSNNSYRMVAGMLFGLCYEYLPPDHWLRRAAHAVVLMTAGEGLSDSVTRDMRALYASDQIGPVGYGLLAKVFQMLGHPASRSFVERSWQLLSAEGFRADWTPLLAGVSKLTSHIQCALEKLQTRKPEDIRLAASIFPEPAAGLLESSFQWLRDNQGKSMQESLDPLLAKMWNDDLEEKIQGLLAEMDITQGIDYYSRVIQRDPGKPMSYYNRGTAYVISGNHAKAIEDFSKAIALDPNYAAAYVNRSRSYLELKDYDQVIADCTRAIAISPETALAYTNRGVAWTEKENYDKAIADYTKAIELDATPVLYYVNRATVYYRMKRFQDAIADCTQAIKLEPNQGMYYQSRGACWYELKEYPKALEDYLKAKELRYPIDDRAIQELRNKLAAAGRTVSTALEKDDMGARATLEHMKIAETMQANNPIGKARKAGAIED